MWKLTIEDDEGKQTTLPLAHDEYALGRAEANSIRLTDRNISRKHAMLAKNGQGWLLRDLDSYNGTFVNGVRVVGEQHLRHGDLVQLGDYRLELLDETLISAPTPAPQGRGTTLSPLHTRPDRLVMIVGPQPGQEFPLEGDRLSIGRSEECPISINHSSVSRHHAELIKIDKGRYEVIDQGSANGIRINGVDLKRGLLEAGDALELGDVRLRFVGAGKIFRPVDTSLINPVVTPGAAAAGAGQKGKSSAWKLVAGLLVVAVVAGVAVYGLTSSADPAGGKQVESVPEAPAQDQGAELLRKAKEAADKGDLDKAHELLQQVPEGSNAREEKLFQELEDAWAKKIMERAGDSASSATQRYDLLARVAGAPTVSAQLRDEAIDKMAEIQQAEPSLQQRPLPPKQQLPQRLDPTAGGSGQFGGPSAPSPTSTGTGTQSKTATEPPPGQVPEASGYAAQRKALEPKVWSGKASLEEIKLLKAICSHMGDRACRDRALAMQKEKEKSGQ